jgi:group II intron reverse transcriptase/maturase
MRFTALLHHVTPELLQASYFDLKRQAAPGVDGVTWQEYGGDLEVRLADLHERIHRGSYRAKPSKRAWIPKADGRQRPLGIAALEDKLVQQAVKTVLEQVYEEDFLGFSYGFRPGRGCHDALDALWVGLTERKVNWVLDADIRGFFDAIDHGWLMKFLEHRIADRRILRLMRKWLRAGVSEDGVWSRTTVGTPQGAVISPLAANVFLHYVLDLWMQQWRTRQARGEVIVVRYADDFVMGFQHRDDAQRCLQALQARFAKFGLELHPEKTRLIELGRFAAQRRNRRGEGKPETFNFLGFTHHCGKTRKGTFTIHRRSIAKRFRAKLQALKQQLRQQMHGRVAKVGRWLRAVVQGWLNYHAVPGNYPSLDQFLKQVKRLWLRTLRRRSQRGRHRWNWDRFSRLARRWLPRPQILHPYPNVRFRVAHPR